MKLIIAIVQDEDAGRLINALMKSGYGVTKLATTGGFLRAGNTTLMVGVEDEKLSGAMAVVEKICKSRRQTVSSSITTLDPTAMGMPGSMAPGVEVTVGGATVFVMDVKQFCKF